jgi:hypothetical protein
MKVASQGYGLPGYGTSPCSEQNILFFHIVRRAKY